MKKIAIIGASYLQTPLIEMAKSMGYETHTFAWRCGDIGERSSDYFYPISIVEKEEILKKCREISIDGICSIASDLAMLTVNYVAQEMGLIGNSYICTRNSTNKYYMRQCFDSNGDPSVKSFLLEKEEIIHNPGLVYPLIVKPTDRSGCRGVTKIYREEELVPAVEYARKQSFEKKVLLEEFATGREYSVEYLSWKGKHMFLAVTEKFTTGSPHFVEMGHLQPAGLSGKMLEQVKRVVEHALDSLGIEYGASHSELKISSDGEIRLIEIGGRMGGDMIGSKLVPLTTGVNFVEEVIRIAMGEEPVITRKKNQSAAIRYILKEEDKESLEALKKEHREYLLEEAVEEIGKGTVLDSTGRFGYYLMAAEKQEALLPYLPEHGKD